MGLLDGPAQDDVQPWAPPELLLGKGAQRVLHDPLDEFLLLVGLGRLLLLPRPLPRVVGPLPS